MISSFDSKDVNGWILFRKVILKSNINKFRSYTTNLKYSESLVI